MYRLIATALIAVTSVGAAAQTARQDGYAQDYGAQARAYNNRVTANGRCNGISYGTGARRCGTQTGGPVGGISGRN